MLFSYFSWKYRGSHVQDKALNTNTNQFMGYSIYSIFQWSYHSYIGLSGLTYISRLLSFSLLCTFYCHRVVKIIAPLLVYVGPQPLGSKGPQQTQLSCGEGCKFLLCDYHWENVVFVLKKQVKWPFLGAVNSSGLTSHKNYSLNWNGIDQNLRCPEMLGPLAFI